VTVLSHRGYWLAPEEKNTVTAFRRSFDLGFGTETDVRDRLGELVISHDPPRGGEITLGEFLDLLAGRDLPLALNVKADGLAEGIRDALAGRGLTRWFVFDMSVPDTLRQLAVGNPVYVRASEYERQPVLLERAAGVWLDGFSGDWWGGEPGDWANRSRPVCLVSPELHGRDPQGVWDRLATVHASGVEGLMLCTDRPEQARRFFAGGGS
jgi:hypothetical protein